MTARLLIAFHLACGLLLGVTASSNVLAQSARHQRAAMLLQEWDFQGAERLISTLAKNTKDNHNTHYLRAELAFLRGNYAGALAVIDAVPMRWRSQFSRLRSLVQGTMDATSGFEKRLSPAGHFEIYFAPGKDRFVVDIAASALDRAYESLGEDFGTRPPTPIRVEILQRPSDLARVSTLKESEIRATGTIALCKYNKLMAVSPRATLFGYAWLDALSHEYVHYVVSTASRDRVPVWLQEGLAKFAQNRWRGEELGRLRGVDEHLLATALRTGDFIGFDAMHPSMAKLPTREAAALAYAQVHTLIHLVHGKIGFAGLRNLIAAIRDGTDAKDALRRALKKSSWKSLENGWKRNLRSRGLKQSPALAGRARYGAVHFDDGGANSENVGASEVADAKARAFVRLGGLLRSRGRLRAAAIEYEKALALTGKSSPFVAGKLARTYLGLNEYDRAIELAAPLLETDEHDAAPPTTLGLAYSQLGKHEQAVSAFEHVLRINPFDPAVRCALAGSYAALNQRKLEKREREACSRLSR